MEERAGGRVRPPGCRLYSTKATSGRVSQIVNPPRRWMSYAGVGRRGRLSTQQATWQPRLGYSHHACAECAVLRQGVMFSGRMLQFSGTRRVSFASCVRRNRHRSQVGRECLSVKLQRLAVSRLGAANVVVCSYRGRPWAAAFWLGARRGADARDGPPGANVGKFSVSCKSLNIKELTAPKTSPILERLRGRATEPGATREVTYRETFCFFR
jgi:hypothetical protein